MKFGNGLGPKKMPVGGLELWWCVVETELRCLWKGIGLRCVRVAQSWGAYLGYHRIDYFHVTTQRGINY